MNQRSVSNLPKIIALSLLLSVLAFAAGCSKNANNANTANSTNSTNLSGTTNKSTTTTTTTSPSGLSPKDTVKAYYEAAAKKDMAAAKSFYSKGTIEFMEGAAKMQGKTLDEMMKESSNAPVVTPEIANESITGDTATVDIKAPTGEALKIPLVKEGGQWKLAFDKMINERLKDASGGPGKSPGAEEDDEDEHGSGNH